MRIAVLVKVVPDLDKLTFDPELRAVERAGVPLFANPFDARAVAAAQPLRAPGGELVLVTMGPPGAEAPLRELLALGADRAVLVSDPALRASDGLVTARVLAKALRSISPDLVLAGSFSTDASTAQVPSQLAELLGWPLVSDARRFVLSGAGALEVTSDTEDGWVRWGLPLPAVVSVGEKVAKPLKGPPAGTPEGPGKPFTILGLGDLEVPPEDVGLRGSPTQVALVEPDAPVRHPQVVRDGSVADRAREAVAAVQKLLPSKPVASLLLPADACPCPDHREVLVLVSGATGEVDPRSLPLLSEVRRRGGGAWPTAVGWGPLDDPDHHALAASGARGLLWAGALPEPCPPEAAVALLEAAMVRRPHAAAVFLPSNVWSREVAGRLSARRGLGLVADATSIVSETREGMVFRKPSFGGGWTATIRCTTRPVLATIRDGAFEPGRLEGPPPSLPLDPLNVTPGVSSVQRVDSGFERHERFGDLAKARVIVAIGMGLGGPEQIPRLLEVVRPLGAALAATRKVVDAGWVPPQLQVGLTGRSVAPDLFLAVGTSGRPNHLVGVRRAKVSVGINSDAEAPLFQTVDVGILGDWREVLPPLVEELQSVLVENGPAPEGTAREPLNT